MHSFYPGFSPQARRQDVVPRAVAVQVARERDAYARELQAARAELARAQHHIRAQAGRSVGARLPDAQHALPAPDDRLDMLRAELAECRGELDAARERSRELEGALRRAAARRERVVATMNELTEEAARRDAELDRSRAALEALEATTRQHAEGAGATDHTEQLRRLSADIEHIKRRRQVELDLKERDTRQATISAFVSLRESLTRALVGAHDHEDPWYTGTDAILRQFDSILEQLGVTLVGAPGERFDPTRHQAIGLVSVDDVRSGDIVSVERSGFAFADGTIASPAQVVVAR